MENDKKELRLIQWDKANFPPIDLNEQYKDVIELINAYKELKQENFLLNARVKYLQDLITEYTGKMLANLEGKDDIPPELFTNR